MEDPIHQLEVKIASLTHKVQHDSNVTKWVQEAMDLIRSQMYAMVEHFSPSNES